MQDRSASTLPTMSQHFKKRKSRTSSAPVSPRRAANDAISHLSSSCATPAVPTTSTATTPEGASLAAALNALKVSLKREIDSFLPPTPAASPVARSAKRARFDFGVILPDPTDSHTDVVRPKASPVPKLRGTAFLSVSKKLSQELERRARPDSSEQSLRARKRRTQLSYFAIASAFHRAAHERERPLVPAQPVE